MSRRKQARPRSLSTIQTGGSSYAPTAFTLDQSIEDSDDDRPHARKRSRIEAVIHNLDVELTQEKEKNESDWPVRQIDVGLDTGLLQRTGNFSAENNQEANRAQLCVRVPGEDDLSQETVATVLLLNGDDCLAAVSLNMT